MREKIRERFVFPIEEMELVGIEEYDVPQYKTGLIGIFDPTNNDLLGYHTSSYKTITNEQLIDMAFDIFDDLGLKINEYETNLSYCNKKRMYLSLITDKVFDLNKNGNSDPHKLMLTLVNSYDGSMAYSIESGIWRQVCSNGMFGWIHLSRFKRKHFAELDEVIVRDKIIQALMKFPDMQTFAKRLKETTLDQRTLDKIFAEALKRNLTSKKEVEEIEGMIPESFNGFMILNAFTYYLTHMAISYEKARKFNSFVSSKMEELTHL